MNAISKTRVLEVNDEEYSEFQGKEWFCDII